MSNASRIAGKIKEKAPRTPRAKKVKVDLSALPDAVVDGKLVVPVKGRVVFERTLNKKTAVHEGYVFSFDEKDGSVSIWDETRGQFYGLNINQPMPVIKIAP
jgi:hypothetical protein